MERVDTSLRTGTLRCRPSCIVAATAGVLNGWFRAGDGHWRGIRLRRPEDPKKIGWGVKPAV